jgi:hypothetical protein
MAKTRSKANWRSIQRDKWIVELMNAWQVFIYSFFSLYQLISIKNINLYNLELMIQAF